MPEITNSYPGCQSGSMRGSSLDVGYNRALSQPFFRASGHVRRHPHPVADRVRRPVGGGAAAAAGLGRTPKAGGCETHEQATSASDDAFEGPAMCLDRSGQPAGHGDPGVVRLVVACAESHGCTSGISVTPGVSYQRKEVGVERWVWRENREYLRMTRSWLKRELDTGVSLCIDA